MRSELATQKMWNYDEGAFLLWVMASLVAIIVNVCIHPVL
jgi:hypothetical protein